MICKLHLEASHEADKIIFITCHEQGLNYHISFATVVEVITKPQIASTCKDAICNKCSKKGHLAKVCRSGSARPEVPKNRKQRQQTNTKKNPWTISTHHLDAGTDEDEYNLFTVTSSTNQPLTVPLTLNGANLIMEIDTGAARSIISDQTFTQLWP